KYVELGNFKVQLIKENQQIIYDLERRKIISIGNREMIYMQDEQYLVKDYGLWGICTVDKMILKPQFIEVRKLSSNLFVFSDYGKKGYFGVYSISKQKIIIPKQYTNFRYILDKDLIFANRDGNTYTFDSNGKELADVKLDEVVKLPFGDVAYYNSNQSILVLSKFNKNMTIHGKNFVNINEYFVQFAMSNLDKGIVLIESGEVHHNGFEEVQALFKDLLLVKKNQKYGVMNKLGNYELELIYDKILYRNGIIAAYINDSLVAVKNLFFNNGKNYESISILDDKLFKIKDAGLYGIADTPGNEIVPMKYSSINFMDNHAKCYIQDHIDIIEFSEKGEVLHTTSFEHISSIKIQSKIENYESILQDKILSMSKDINAVFAKEKTKSINNLSKDTTQGFWTRNDENRYGYKINQTRYSIKPQYDFGCVLYFSFSAFGILKNKKYHPLGITFDKVGMLYGIINHMTGKVLLKPQFLWIDTRMLAATNGGYTAAINIDSEFVFIDTLGRIIDNQYKYISTINDGFIKVYQGGQIMVTPAKSRTINVTPGTTYKQFIHELNDRSEIYLDEYDRRLWTNKTEWIQYEGGIWLILDKNLNISINNQFEYMSDFEFGRSIVKKDGLWGVIDTLGNWIVPNEYWNIKKMSLNGVNYFKLCKKGESNTEENTFDEEGLGLAIVRQGNNYNYINSEGAILNNLKFEAVKDFSGGYASVKLTDKWRILNEDGELLNNFVASHSIEISEGMIPFHKYRYGFKNISDDTIMIAKYDGVGKFVGGICPVKIAVPSPRTTNSGLSKEKEWYYVNQDFNRIDKEVYYRAFNFNKNGYAKVIRHDGDEAGYVTLDGKYTSLRLINKSNLDAEYSVFCNTESTKYYLKNKKGRTIFTVHSPSKVYSVRDSVFHYRKLGYDYYINLEGNKILRKTKYFGGTCFANGYALVKKKILVFQTSKQKRDSVASFIIDKSGNEFPLEVYYDNEFRPNNGVFVGWKNRYKRTFYNLNGDRICDTSFLKAEPFEFNVSRVKFYNGKWGLIDNNGEILVPPVFDEIKPFVRANHNDDKLYYGLFDWNGNVVFPIQYSKLQALPSDYLRLELNNAVGYYHPSKNWIWNLKE
ncbi:MAG: WG repeat-containing protein, partial [Bacteroidetes bacterium]|nr:WG repeat-containing protein [Bacteroidota bacterium]